MESSKHHRLFSSLILCTLSLGALLPAQVGKSDTIIAPTRGKGSFTKGIQLVTQNMSDCKAGKSLALNVNGAMVLSRLYNGGAAYDAVRGGVWFSNGFDLGCVDPISGKSICRTQVLPVTPRLGKLSPFSITTGGLAFDNKENTLYLADAINGDLYQIRLGSSSDPRACQFKSGFAIVRTHMPSFHWLGGLAIDQVNRLLFVGSHHMTKGTRHIYVTSLNKWGGKLKDVTGKGGSQPPLCPNGQTAALWIQGMSFDSARSILHVTDGTTTSAYRYDASKFELTPLSCCKNPSSKQEDNFAGLALLPASSSKTGRPCSTAPCQSCTGMQLQTRGNASLGNPHFELSLTGAPDSAGKAVAAIGLGSCNSPGANFGFCAPVLISLNSVLVLGVKLKTGSRCSTTGSLPIPVPADVKLFGIKVSCQFLMECRSSSSVGYALTNCVSFEVTRN